jgi:hypothetical protein
VVAGGRTDSSTAAAAEFVARFSINEFDATSLLDDLMDPRLDIRLCGDLVLLAESLTVGGADELLAGLTELADCCDDTAAALEVVDACCEYLDQR